MATLAGRTAGSTLPPCDTPGADIRQLTDIESSPDGLSRARAEAAWHAVTSSIAGTPHVRISKDGGRTYPARHARPLPADPPGQPCTVPVYDPGAAAGRMLALDLDPARGRGAADPAAQVSAQAEAIARLVTRLGGRCVTDVAPSGGRHVLILFTAALPWRELRDLARAMALRFPAVDVAPMSSLGGQISPPGSRHKSGGWRTLTSPLQDARAAAGQPNGPGVWNALLAEFAAELRQGSTAADLEVAELDDAGVPWLPRLGGRAPLGELERTARTGEWDRSRYPGRSEARMAVLAAAAARGWRLAELRAAVASGAWRGLARLYERPSEPGRMDRLLPYEWRKAVDLTGGQENVRRWHTSDLYPRPPAGLIDGADEYGLIRRWMTAVACALEDPERVRQWGGRAIAVRLVLLALGQAAMVSGSSVLEFGCRNLALHAALSHRTVARVLELLRNEPDPLIDLVLTAAAGPGRQIRPADPRPVCRQCPVASSASWPDRRGTPGVPRARRRGRPHLSGPRPGRSARRRSGPDGPAVRVGDVGRAAGTRRAWPGRARPRRLAPRCCRLGRYSRVNRCGRSAPRAGGPVQAGPGKLASSAPGLPGRPSGAGDVPGRLVAAGRRGRVRRGVPLARALG